MEQVHLSLFRIQADLRCMRCTSLVSQPRLTLTVPANRDDKRLVIRFRSQNPISRRSGEDCIISSPLSTHTLMTEDGLQSTRCSGVQCVSAVDDRMEGRSTIEDSAVASCGRHLARVDTRHQTGAARTLPGVLVHGARLRTALRWSFLIGTPLARGSLSFPPSLVGLKLHKQHCPLPTLPGAEHHWTDVEHCAPTDGCRGRGSFIQNHSRQHPTGHSQATNPRVLLCRASHRA